MLGIDLELYASKQGFQTGQLAGTIDELRNSVDKGIPPIVLVDYGFSFYQRNHFMVVKGYSGSALLVNSGGRIPQAAVVRFRRVPARYQLQVRGWQE